MGINSNGKKEKSAGKKLWYFLWEDNSVWSWVVSLILAFIIVKFLFFPLLSFGLNNSLPLVVIESGSMHHEGSWFKDLTGVAITSGDRLEGWWDAGNGEWYEERNIILPEAEDWRFSWGMDKGDIVVVYGEDTDDLEVGDVVIFNAGQANPIIHRIVDIREENGTRIFSTKGDNNTGQLTFEKNIGENQIIGKAVLRVNKVGWVKLIFVEIFRAFS